MTTWLDVERTLLVGVLLKHGANIGMAKYRLTSVHESLASQGTGVRMVPDRDEQKPNGEHNGL